MQQIDVTLGAFKHIHHWILLVDARWSMPLPGEYLLVMGESANSNPLWKQTAGKFWLYSGPNRRWRTSTEKKEIPRNIETKQDSPGFFLGGGFASQFFKKIFLHRCGLGGRHFSHQKPKHQNEWNLEAATKFRSSCYWRANGFA